MARDAGDLRMLAEQLEPRARMVELCAFPPRRCMAFAAVRPQPLFVVIVLRVAGEACARRVAEALVLVAAFALRLAMQAAHRKTGALVIEARRLLPSPLRVAALAFIAERALVRVIFAMAGIAGVGRPGPHRYIEMA